MDRITYWTGTKWDDRIVIDLPFDISDTTEKIHLRRERQRTMPKDWSLYYIVGELHISRLDNRWAVDFLTQDKSLPSGLRYQWKSVYQRNKVNEIIRYFFEDTLLSMVHWSKTYSKTTRELDRREILWGMRIDFPESRFDFTEKEYQRLRKLAVSKKLPQELIDAFDLHYDKSYWGTERQAEQRGRNRGGVWAFWGWRSEIKNYLQIAQIIMDYKAGSQIEFDPGLQSLFLNPTIKRPLRTIQRVRRTKT